MNGKLPRWRVEELFGSGGVMYERLGIIYALMQIIFGIVLHIYTVGLLYYNYDWLVATIGFFTPLISEIYVLIVVWSRIGWLNYYTMAIFAYTVICVIPAIMLYTNRHSRR